MELFRCSICGEAGFGAERPSHCPFCGALRPHLELAIDYEPTALGELSRKSQENLERLVELATENAGFFRGASKVADQVEGKTLFAVLAQVEAKHVAVLCTLLGSSCPEELQEPGACSPAHKENVAEARKRLERTLNLCRRFLDEAGEERVRQVLEAFAETAADQLSFTL